MSNLIFKYTKGLSILGLKYPFPVDLSIENSLININMEC